VTTTRRKFDSELRRLLDKNSKAFPDQQWTPFWATGKNGMGHPLQAKLVVIGFNPSSGVDGSWFNFWDANTGFNMRKFQQARSKAVQLHNQVPGNKQKRPISKTREKINLLAKETIGPNATYINTNVYWAVSPRARLLRNKFPAPLLWLIQRVPRDAVIVLHGVAAKRAYGKLKRTYAGLPNAIRAARHLCLISNDDFADLKKKIRATLKRSPASGQKG
jgi:hypothetical protein